MEIKIGTVIKDKYQVLERIGDGGTAIVYLAKNNETNQIVVLKVSKNDARVSSLKERFLLEAQSLIKFDNKNIVKVYEYFDYKDSIVIVMEHLRGKTLKEIVTRKEVQIQQAIGIILQVLNALKDIHSKGLIHRDLKPENLMVGIDGVVKILDFGIVQVSMEQNLTRQGFVIGTITHMSPEVLNQKKALPQSEIYSLGVVLYYILARTLPFKDSDPKEIARKHLYDKAIPLYKINPRVDTLLSGIVDKMMEKDYLKRYQSAEELIKVFNDYMNINLGVSNESEARKLLKINQQEVKEEKKIEKKSFFKKLFGKS